jgi:hypothetical protein
MQIHITMRVAVYNSIILCIIHGVILYELYSVFANIYIIVDFLEKI